MQFYGVDVLNFIFRIGVLLAIYNFLWWLIDMGLSLLRGGRRKMRLEAYLIKFVKYFFLVDVTLLFCIDSNLGSIDLNRVTIAGLVLLIYFVGRIQSNQLQRSLFSIQGNMPGMQEMLNRMRPVFDLRFEIGVILLAIGAFTAFIFFPDWAMNPISNWFLETILDIEDTPIFGFVFKVIGFFFMVSIIMKVTQGFMTMLTGGGIGRGNRDRRKDDDDEDQFDDYTEID